MRGFSPGIQQGVAVSLWVKNGSGNQGAARVRFRDDLNAAKAAERRADLLASLDAQDFAAHYAHVSPSLDNRYNFRPQHIEDHYAEWPQLTELAAHAPLNGPIERRALALISIEKAPLEHRMRSYFDTAVTNEEIAAIYPSLMMTGNRIVGPEARSKILKEWSFDTSRIVRYPFKPFDSRWCYLENLRPLFSEPSPELLRHRAIKGNLFFVSRDMADKEPEGPPFFFGPTVCDYHLLAGEARHFPALVLLEPAALPDSANHDLFGHQEAAEPTIVANLSAGARGYLESLGLPEPDNGEADGLPVHALIWWHALAVGYSPAYLAEHADGIRGDWPRIPLPATAAALIASATLGRELAALLDTENTVAGVTAGKPRAELATIAVLATAGNIALDEGQHLKLTAGWGHAGKGNVTMPGKGKLDTRPRRDDERVVGDEALGDDTRDVWLNNACCWRNVPRPVWEYTIGGYQVIKKWLSYREKELLGRGLAPEEVRYVTEMARRIAALIALQPALDANYRAVAADTVSWAELKRRAG